MNECEIFCKNFAHTHTHTTPRVAPSAASAYKMETIRCHLFAGGEWWRSVEVGQGHLLLRHINVTHYDMTWSIELLHHIVAQQYDTHTHTYYANSTASARWWRAFEEGYGHVLLRHITVTHYDTIRSIDLLHHIIAQQYDTHTHTHYAYSTPSTTSAYSMGRIWGHRWPGGEVVASCWSRSSGTVASYCATVWYNSYTR